MFYTQEQFNAMKNKLAKSYNVTSVSEMFQVSPPRAVALLDAIQQSVQFLQSISVIHVTDSVGDIITMNAPNSVAGRTDTTKSERKVTIAGDNSGRQYAVKQTNYDIGIRYSTIDAFRRFSDYEQRILNMIYRRIGLDQLLIGWYGQGAAADTDRSANPLLQDVNTGWLYDLEQNKPENFLKAETGKKLVLGAKGDWENLDHLAYELLSLIPEEHRTGDEVVLVGRQIVAHESGKLFAKHGQTPSEKVLFDVLAKTYGGLAATSPSGFPDMGVMVTDPVNLQIYVQEGSIRRKLCDAPMRDQIEHYHSQNDCFRIGDLKGAVAVNYADMSFAEDTNQQ